MRVGVVGCGGMGTTHLRALRSLKETMGVEVTAIADIRSMCRERAATVWPDARQYERAMDLIKEADVDWVHICLPSDLHAEHAIAALDAGRHVFIEKPVCLNGEDAKALLEAKKRSGKTVMVGHVVRWFAAYEYLKKVYDSKEYGELKSIVMKRVGSHPTNGIDNWFLDWRRSGGVMMDLHIHDLDFLRYMIGEPDSRHMCVSSFEDGTPNQMVAAYEFGNVWACAEACWDRSTSMKFTSTYRASFENATVVYGGRDEDGVTIYPVEGDSHTVSLSSEAESEAGQTEINVSTISPYCAEDIYFVTCLKNGIEPEKASLETAVRSALLAKEELDEALEILKNKKNQ